jgi:hypothetical protein
LVGLIEVFHGRLLDDEISGLNEGIEERAGDKVFLEERIEERENTVAIIIR